MQKCLMFPTVLLLVMGCCPLCGFAEDVAKPAVDQITRTRDVIYGRKNGVVLTMDVFRPKQQNGAGLIYVVSGGWFSSHAAINPKFAQAW